MPTTLGDKNTFRGKYEEQNIKSMEKQNHNNHNNNTNNSKGASLDAKDDGLGSYISSFAKVVIFFVKFKPGIV